MHVQDNETNRPNPEAATHPARQDNGTARDCGQASCACGDDQQSGGVSIFTTASGTIFRNEYAVRGTFKAFCQPKEKI